MRHVGRGKVPSLPERCARHPHPLSPPSAEISHSASLRGTLLNGGTWTLTSLVTAQGLVLKQQGRKPEERWGWRAVCTDCDQNEHATALPSRQPRSLQDETPTMRGLDLPAFVSQSARIWLIAGAVVLAMLWIWSLFSFPNPTTGIAFSAGSHPALCQTSAPCPPSLATPGSQGSHPASGKDTL